MGAKEEGRRIVWVLDGRETDKDECIWGANMGTNIKDGEQRMRGRRIIWVSERLGDEYMGGWVLMYVGKFMRDKGWGKCMQGE